jgi:GAF domain-containing protein
MDGAERLARVFVELADTLVDEFDQVDFLQMLVDRLVELLGADAAGLMLADQRGSLQLMASSVEEARDLEVFELQMREGPCVDCFATGQAVVNVDLADAYERWPVFTPAAVEAGFRASHALPLRLRRQVLGAMNLFTEEPRRLDDEHIAIGQAMADVATIGLLHERNLREQTVLSEQLQSALHSRVLIEQAKGVLAARTGVGVAEAFAMMRSHARRHGLPLTAVAAAVIDGSLAVQGIAGA